MARLAALHDAVLDAQGGALTAGATIRAAGEAMERLRDPDYLERRRVAECEKQERLDALHERPREPRRNGGPPRGHDAVLNGAREVLREAGEPLHYGVIAERVTERGLARVGGEKPARTVGWYLNKAAKDPDSGIERVGRGRFRAA